MNYKSLHILLFLVTAPFIGILCWLAYQPLTIKYEEVVFSTPASTISLDQDIMDIHDELSIAENGFLSIKHLLAEVYDMYLKSASLANELVYRNSFNVEKPIHIYDRRVIQKLGKPSKHIESENIDLKLFPIQEQNYTGYALKVHLKTDHAMKMVLGHDSIGKSETTLSAAKRYQAIAGINAGGFADDRRTGKRYPLSTTMYSGKYVYGFEPSYADLFFVGINEQNKLIGGSFRKQSELDQLDPVFGASFVPILIQDGQKQSIPNKWLTSPRRAARTVIANYRHDHLIFLVTNGNSRGRAGATLPEIQNKLIQLGVVNAYNLDGGGSTSLIWENQILNIPSDGKLRPLSTHFLFFD